MEILISLDTFLEVSELESMQPVLTSTLVEGAFLGGIFCLCTNSVWAIAQRIKVTLRLPCIIIR